jgi:hypothetical protein
VPRLIVLDNPKVAVIKACLYEPQVNRWTAVLPTGPRGPHDKATAEARVLIVERWLADHVFDRNRLHPARRIYPADQPRWIENHCEQRYGGFTSLCLI